MKNLVACITFMNIISLCAMGSKKNERVEIDDIYNVDQAVKYFAPLVYLSKNEKYKPSSFDWYLQRVSLKNSIFDVIKSTGSVTPQDLADHPNNSYLDPDGVQETYFGPSLQEGKVVEPMYINYKVADNQKSAKLQTIYFYPFNGATPFLSNFEFLYDCFGKSVGNHEADLERTTFTLQYDDDKEDWKIVSGFYSHHGSGILVSPEHMRFEGSHPIVGSAKYGHASYPDYFCINCEGDTVEEGGACWEGWKHYEVLHRENTPDNQKWIKFAGRLGVDKEINPNSAGTELAPTGLGARDWFKDVTN